MLKLDEEATGRRYQEWMRQPELFAQIAQALDGEATGGVEFVLARDPSRTCVSRAAPAGEPEGGAILVLHDISDLRRADRVRRDFVANVSHELRTPLTAIRGYVEALLDDPPGPEESRRFLEIIARHSTRMERLVKDLLRLARLDAGQETTDMVDCDVASVLQGVITDLSGPIDQRRSQVDVRLAPDARTVVSDPAKLHDVLAEPDRERGELRPRGRTGRRRGRARAETALVRARRRQRAGHSHRPTCTRVFERFYRVDKSRSRAPGRHGHRPGHREAPGGVARRDSDGGLARRRRGGVHRAFAAAVVATEPPRRLPQRHRGHRVSFLGATEAQSARERSGRATAVAGRASPAVEQRVRTCLSERRSAGHPGSAAAS